MSREGGSAGGSRRDGVSSRMAPAQMFPPQFYPVVGYQGPPHSWFPPHPSTGVPGQWSPSWRPSMSYPTPTPLWSDQQTPATTTTAVANTPSDEYTVDTLRRIYKDDDGRVEIQRVKVHRRQPETGNVSLSGPEAMSVVPVGSIPQNERRPPPRKHRKNPEIHMAAMGPTGPYPWYPYMPPYMPYPYPYPYYLAGCMWPPGAVPSDTLSTWSGNEGSEAVSSRQDSQRLESRSSHLSSTLHRSSSPAAASHITDTHSIAPSDSVSVRGRKRETSLERALRGPTPPPRTKSRASSSLGGKSDDAGKTQEWMLEMQRALRTKGDVAVKIRDLGTVKSDNTEVYKKIPPVRKRRKMKADDMSDKSSMTDVSEQQSVVSESMFDDSRLSSELNYAFRKFERSVDAFKTEVTRDPSPIQSHPASPSVEICHSSGDITPTEAHASPLPLSDISGLAEKAKEEEIKRRVESRRPRAISESISSLPSLETARIGSTPDVSLQSKLIVASSSQFTPSAATSTTRVATDTVSPSPSIHAPESIETTEVTSKTEEAVIDAPRELSTSKSSDTTTSHSPKTSILRSQPSSPPPASPLPATTPTEATAKGTETGISEPEQGVPPTTGIPTEKLTQDSASATSVAAAPSGVEGVGEASGRQSQASSATTFFSVRTTDDSHTLDTDSTDIPLPATADESEESAGSVGPEDKRLWVLQRPEEAPTLNTAGQDERRNAWRAEVSLWRARLVVSLCRGRGLDRQDWATLHLMVHHPLTLDLKLSLLHAPRLCAANSSVGPAVLRVALLQLAQYGEVLLQPEASRQPGWRSVRLDQTQAWTPVKGAAEILQSLGYQERRDGVELRYRRCCGVEASVVARLTLDMLVLAEEFRLFLTGAHQYPNNVSSLFFPESVATSTMPDLPQRPTSSEGSFVSAQSEAVSAARPQSKASITTDEDTETLQTCVVETRSLSKLSRNKSTSEEEVTLREDEDMTKNTANEAVEGNKRETTQQLSSETDAKTPSENSDVHTVNDSASICSEVTSLPDLQSTHSTTESQRPSGSEVSSSGNETVIAKGDSTSKVNETNSVTKPVTAPATATNDNPEEHVYEEIDVIRSQVQSLRASSVPTESAPPPLPPKKKISSGGEDDSGLSLTYPHMEWSSASMPGSLRGGSASSARRKKRRAPMPPEFLPPNWKESQETTKKEDPEAQTKVQESPPVPDTAKKAEYRRSLNPFYEEIDNLEENNATETINTERSTRKPDSEGESGNPFFERPVKATGYIGKNPFYDDVEILKKSDEYKEIENNHSSPAAPTSELVPATTAIPEQPSDPPAVRPKRRAPRPPPPTPETLATQTTDRPDTAASPQQSEGRYDVVSASQAAEIRTTESDGNVRSYTQTSERNLSQTNAESSSLASQESSKINSEGKTEAELDKELNTNTVQKDSTAPLTPVEAQQTRGAEAERVSTPKQNRATRASLSHPKTPPPPPPTPIKASASVPSEESPPPVPPPKAPLSLLDEIPYMDANEVKEAQRSSSLTSGSPVAPPKVSPSLTLIHGSDDEDLLPPCPPPPPPGPPPESPPETPHVSPPETPHVSPPETPHTSPPETPHTSPPATPPRLSPQNSPLLPPRLSPKQSPVLPPRLSPKQSPILPPRHHVQDPLTTTEKAPITSSSSPGLSPKTSPLLPPRNQAQDSPATTEKCPAEDRVIVTGKNEDQAPPVPPKITQLESQDSEPSTTHPQPPQITQKEETDSLHPQKTVHSPAAQTHSVQSSTSEERYEIPDTSRAPPPRPPVPVPPKMQQQQQQQQVNGKTPPAKQAEYDRYEVPEAPKSPGGTIKAPEVEERYEIPEVVKDQSRSRGVNGGPCTVPLGRTLSPRRGQITAVFGPPKPPRRRRNNQSPPPPRPPKNPGIRHYDLSETGNRAPSTTSSLTSSSSGPSPASLQHKKTPKRRSWPFLLCDCLYVNCRTYEDADKT